MDNLIGGIWASVSEGCPMSCTVDGSDVATVAIGASGLNVELLLDAASVRKLATLTTQAVADMDARYEQEAAERDVREQAAVPAGCSA